MEGGLTMSAWMTLWYASHAITMMGVWRIDWPDGGCTLDQPAILVAVFDLIDSMRLEASK